MRRFLVTIFLGVFLFAYEPITSYKIAYLKAYAQDNPDDISSREFLLRYYYKINDKKNILKYSKEIHSLDPENKTLSLILKKLDMKIKHQKISNTLKSFLKQKKFTRYLNLYQALIDTQKKVPDNYHIDALYSAIMINNFKLAKQILKRDDLPMSPHLTDIMRILDKKLGNDTNL